MKRVLIILALVLLVGCITPSPPPTICEQKAKELIPNKITLFRDSGDSFEKSGDLIRNRAFVKPFQWNDGTYAGNVIGLSYRAGWKQDQNINWRYPFKEFVGLEEFDPHPLCLTYNKKMIASDGRILGNNRFGVKFLLKEIPGSKGKYTPGVTYSTLDYEIVDTEFCYCEWVG